MRAPWKAQQQVATELTGQKTGTRASRREFLLYLGPALMVSLAYMDHGNYGNDLVAGSSFKFGLFWVFWLASGMARLLHYISGNLGTHSAHSRTELV